MSKYHVFKHFITINKHRHRVLKKAMHMGIFFFSLHHDLSKLSPQEFFPSAKYYQGTSSPIYAQRCHENYFSSICQHHVRRNPHHWEYWTDFFNGYLFVKTMPYKWATEYVCDMLSASMVYAGKSYKPSMTIAYFRLHSPHFYMTEATKKYIDFCLEEFAKNGWKNLKKKNTLAKYNEIVSSLPDVEIIRNLHPGDKLPEIVKD